MRTADDSMKVVYALLVLGVVVGAIEYEKSLQFIGVVGIELTLLKIFLSYEDPLDAISDFGSAISDFGNFVSPVTQPITSAIGAKAGEVASEAMSVASEKVQESISEVPIPEVDLEQSQVVPGLRSLEKREAKQSMGEEEE